MRLLGKQVLMIICDGVEQSEVEQLREAFLAEQAVVLVTSPQEYISVETVNRGGRGADIQIDLPFEAVQGLPFDAVVVPDGLLSADMLSRQDEVVELVKQLHEKGVPIFASGEAVRLLYQSQVLSNRVVVREGTPLSSFVDKAVGVLLECRPASHLYRAAA